MPDTAPTFLPSQRSSRLPTRRGAMALIGSVWGGAVWAGAGFGGLTASVRSSSAAEVDPPTVWFREALEKLTGGRALEQKLVKLEMPDLAENGNVVPFEIVVDSPMTANDFVRVITILSPGNPQPVIARFELSHLSGAARVGGRLRLAKTQDVLVVAELSSGTLVSGVKRVEVIVGGCGVG
jgi:sulfur-oxidizing protein SoxY